MADAATPVAVVTGFLGSGKTTLLRRLLTDPALADSAVLVNEFGEIGLDHLLLERIDAETVLLASGCLCCTIRGELADAMRGLHSRRDRGAVPWFRNLMIETTGLADPYPVLTTLRADPVLRHHFRIGCVVTTVDSVNGIAQLDRRAETVKQVAVADRIVLTKTDIAPPAPGLLARLAAINPAAPMLRAAEDRIDAALLRPAEGWELVPRNPALRAWAEEEPRHGLDIRSFALVFDGAVDWSGFGVWLSMLLHRHGERVLRVKGILAVEGAAGPVAVHGVQHLVHPPTHLREWRDEDRRSRLVFITQGLERAVVEHSLATFLGLAAIG